ncbi:unnamed protein product [Cercopithifilaria johnstoni]|uniref:Uncharacterized protein n=1 Tax=Cercopithifilaria johnstoni TaxID=2874296 RepID=A0A8J2PXF8_9BILA|nr:unnamed protein product [Cercopithifilaria johnstoni]
MSVFVPPTLNADQEEGRLFRMLRRPTKRKYSAVRIVSTVSTGFSSYILQLVMGLVFSNLFLDFATNHRNFDFYCHYIILYELSSTVEFIS